MWLNQLSALAPCQCLTRREERRVDVPAADHGHALDAEGRSEDFTRAGEVDALLAAGDPRDVQPVEIGDVVAADALARHDQEWALARVRLVPEERAARINDDLLAVGVGIAGKRLMTERRVLRLEDSGARHLQLCRHAPADAARRGERVERAVILLHAGQLLGHGAVDAPSTAVIIWQIT